MPKKPKWVIFGLLSIIVISILLRLIKLFDFAIWGSDSGEHYFLLEQLITTGEIQLEYNGWGFAYPYFPGMHLLVTGTTQTGQLSTYLGLVLIIPIVAAFSVLIIFCISQIIFKDYRISLISSAFTGVILPHIYASSHPMPGSLGGLLLLVCIFLILKSYNNKKFFILLILATAALVITHHLTTFFLIISIFFIIIVREIYKNEALEKEYWLSRSKIDIIYLTILITFSFSYWFIYAEPFYDKILEKNIPISPIGIFISAYVGLILLWVIIKYRDKLSWRIKPTFYSNKNLLLRLSLFWIFGTIILALGLITTVPGTNMKSDISAFPIFLPIMLLISFVAVSPAILVFYKNGITIFGWMLAIMASLIFSFITNNHELLLYRHLPYIFEPISIMASLGFVKLFDFVIKKGDLRLIQYENNKEIINLAILFKTNKLKQIKIYERKTEPKPSKQVTTKILFYQKTAGIIFILTILLTCSIYSYPPLNVVSGFEEGTTEEELDSCFWSLENLPKDATVASDHRMSSILFGFSGLNATWEYAPKTFHYGTYDEIMEEMNSTRIPSGIKRIDFILITSAIENGVALEQWETAEPMSKSAIEKFDSEPFIKLYDNGESRIYFDTLANSS
jgi:hypothetical protein